MSYYTVLLLGAISGGAVAIWLFSFKHWKKREWGEALGSTFVSGVVGLCLGLAFTAFVASRWGVTYASTHIVYGDNYKPVIVPIGRSYWKSELAGRKVLLAGDLQKRHIQMKVQPITENPKVREIRYFVDIQYDHTAESCLKRIRTLKEEPEITVKRILFDFQNDESKELATLWNPLDPLQQAKFRKLLDDYCEPKIPTFIVICDSRFEL